MLWPLLQSLPHGGAQLLQDREAEPGLAHVALLVEVVGTLGGHSEALGAWRAVHGVLQEGGQKQLAARQLLVQLSVLKREGQVNFLWHSKTQHTNPLQRHLRTKQVIEARHQWRSDLIGRHQGLDVLLAVTGRRRAAVPQRLGVSQTEALVDLHQRVDGRRRQEVTVARILQVLHFLLLLRGRSLQAGL